MSNYSITYSTFRNNRICFNFQISFASTRHVSLAPNKYTKNIKYVCDRNSAANAFLTCLEQAEQIARLDIVTFKNGTAVCVCVCVCVCDIVQRWASSRQQSAAVSRRRFRRTTTVPSYCIQRVLLRRRCRRAVATSHHRRPHFRSLSELKRTLCRTINVSSGKAWQWRHVD